MIPGRLLVGAGGFEPEYAAPTEQKRGVLPQNSRPGGCPIFCFLVCNSPVQNEMCGQKCGQKSWLSATTFHLPAGGAFKSATVADLNRCPVAARGGYCRQFRQYKSAQPSQLPTTPRRATLKKSTRPGMRAGNGCLVYVSVLPISSSSHAGRLLPSGRISPFRYSATSTKPLSLSKNFASSQ